MIDPETARGLFVLSVLLVLALAKCLHVAYQLGKAAAIRELFPYLPRPASRGPHPGPRL
jgi:hypothetical protein